MEDAMENIESFERARDFYADKSVLITGFTGYLGKMFAEKLLWVSPEIKSIYILVRGSKKKTVQERLKEIYDLMLFNRLRERDGEKWMDKIIPIEGDLSKENIGMTETDFNTVTNSVSVVIHSAAHVLFNDPLNIPVNINTLGTKNLCDLALHMKKLESFLYISTAYSNCHSFSADEKVYPPLTNWKDLLKICDKIPPEIIAILTNKFISPQPNTYTFSKQIAESVVDSYRDDIPVSIVRPSIVVATWKKPMPGWSDSKFGPNIPFIGGISGVMTSILSNPEITNDTVYIDWVINGCVLAAMKRATLPKKLDETPVYNATQYDRSITNQQFNDYTRQQEILDDVKASGYRIFYRLIKSKFWFLADYYPRSVISAFFIDMILRMLGKPQLVVKIRRKIFDTVSALSYFTCNVFYFKNHKFLGLLKASHPEEADELGYDIPLDYDERIKIIKESFVNGYMLGVKQVVGKELYDRADELSIYVLIMFVLDNTCFYLTYLLLLYIGCKLFSPFLVIPAMALFAIGFYRNVGL